MPRHSIKTERQKHCVMHNNACWNNILHDHSLLTRNWDSRSSELVDVHVFTVLRLIIHTETKKNTLKWGHTCGSWSCIITHSPKIWDMLKVALAQCNTAGQVYVVDIGAITFDPAYVPVKISSEDKDRSSVAGRIPICDSVPQTRHRARLRVCRTRRTPGRCDSADVLCS